MSAYEWLIGTRYLRSTHRRGFVSFVALMSVCGLMLGVATLIVVLSVMNGFERELRTRILAVTSHATIAGFSGPLSDWQALQRQVLRQPGVVAAVPYVESQAMLANGHHTEIGVQGRERIVRNLGPRGRDRADEGRLARIGQSEEPDVRDHPQLELQ